MSRNRNRRYYDDSDDMIERVRRAREAFEKKVNAFQGPDWPGYDKRIVVGKKKKEDVPAAQAQSDAAPAPASAETTQASSQPNNVPEASTTTVDQTSSWWATQREAQKNSSTAVANDHSTDSSVDSDDKAIS